MNSRRIANPNSLEHIANIARELPNTRFLFDIPLVDEEIVSDHLNGSLKGYDNSPLFALNSIYEQVGFVDVSLIQSFFGQNELQIRAVTNSLHFMALSNPKPLDWIFVEAQRSEKNAKFKWVVNLGAKYVFVKIENDKQDHFIKERLWDIGKLHANSDNLVFVDSDVSYCQMDWLKYVAKTFSDGYQLFQPHAWSWNVSKPNGIKSEVINNLNLMESFAHKYKMCKSIENVIERTSYDIAISRRCFASEQNAIGCSNLICFHNRNETSEEVDK